MLILVLDLSFAHIVYRYFMLLRKLEALHKGFQVRSNRLDPNLYVPDDIPNILNRIDQGSLSNNEWHLLEKVANGGHIKILEKN